MKDLSANNWLTPSQCAKLLDCTTRTINNMITSGKLSATREDGRWYIDKSELFRVFPGAHKKELEGNPHFFKLEQERIKIENQMLKDALTSKDKEIEFLRDQIGAYNKQIDTYSRQFLEAIQGNTKLLEYQSKKIEEKDKKTWIGIFKRRDK